MKSVRFLKNSEKGTITPLVIVTLLIIGIVVGTKLINVPQIFKSRAADSTKNNTKYRTWNGVKTLAEMKQGLTGYTIPDIYGRSLTSYENKDAYQIFKAYQYLPAVRLGVPVPEQRLFSCQQNVGDLNNMPAAIQEAEVGKEVAITFTQKWEDSLDGCATGSVVPKVFLNDTLPQSVIWQDWGSGQFRKVGGYADLWVDIQNAPTWNPDFCFAKLDIDPNNPGELDRDRSLYRLGAGRFVQYGSGGGWYETFVRSCYFTPTQPGNYIVEGHFTHGSDICRFGADGKSPNNGNNNKGDLVQQCRFTVYPAGQAPVPGPTSPSGSTSGPVSAAAPTATISVGVAPGVVGGAIPTVNNPIILNSTPSIGSGKNLKNASVYVAKRLGSGSSSYPGRVSRNSCNSSSIPADVKGFNCQNDKNSNFDDRCVWCRIGYTTSSGQFTASFTPDAAGEYDIITSVEDSSFQVGDQSSNGLCSSNPYVPYSPTYKDGYGQFSSCGSALRVTVR